MTIKFTDKQVESIADFNGGFTDSEGNWQDVEVVEEGDWQVEHKCEQRRFIFKYQDRYFAFWETRWGSHWQGYEYEYGGVGEDVYEVKQVEKTITVWEAVK